MGPADRSSGKAPAMLDLGTSFLTSVARDPQALAIVDGDVRLTYSAWYERISALVAGLDALATTDVSSVRKLGFAGAPMTDGLLKSLKTAFKPELFVNHYGSSKIYTFTI